MILVNEKDFDLKQVLDFPVMKARVEYDGPGYRQLFG
jgi:hypothetical protein